MNATKVRIVQGENILQNKADIHNDVFYDNKYYYQLFFDKDGNSLPDACGNVVKINCALVNFLSSEINYDISYRSPQGVLYNRIISREYFDEKKLLLLKKEGIDVNNKTAGTLVKVLENQERSVPFKWVYDRLGWYDDTEGLIYLGLNTCIGKDASYLGGWEDVKKAGSKEEWIDMVNNHVVGSPSMELALAIGFASTAIGFMKREIPTLDYLLVHAVGNSSCGKTTAGELIVSMGSYPKASGKERSMMMDYSSTDAALIKSLTEISSMPCAIDEASLCSNKNKALLIYQIAMGREKARLNPDASLKSSGYWESVTFSTGEHNLLNFGVQNAGLWVRCINIALDFWTDSAYQSSVIKKTVMNNYGHITEEFATYLLEIKNSGNMDKLIDQYQSWVDKLIAKYEEQGKKTNLTERLAGNLAILLMSLQTGAECIGIEVNTNAVADLLVDQCSSEMLLKMDLGENAYNVLMQEITRQPDKILKCNNKDMPHSMWGKHFSDRAYTLPDGRETRGTILILESALRDILFKNNFLDTGVVLKEWKEKKILVCLKDRLMSKKKLQVNGAEATTYEIRIITSNDSHNIVHEAFSHQLMKKVSAMLLEDDLTEEETEEYPEESYGYFEEPTYGGKINRNSVFH